MGILDAENHSSYLITRRILDTSDLGIRFGLNSGPITGGVMRGERARFQLFGETGMPSSLA